MSKLNIEFSNVIKILMLTLTVNKIDVLTADADGVVSAIEQRGDRLSFTELCDLLGLPVEEYDVVTEDGYILGVFRIPGEKPPILLVHGIELAADCWLLRGNKSLPVLLAKQGHDLWFANVRGNIYSRRHLYLDPDVDAEFWDFSFHEHGFYDLPATIDAILDKTNSTKINSIGHSQGNTMFYVLTATRPEYIEKVNLTIALAPIAYLDNLRPPVSAAIALSPKLNLALKALGVNELLGYNNTATKVIRKVCTLPTGYAKCAFGFTFVAVGFDPQEIGPSFFRITNYYFPTGSSRKNLIHLTQVGKSGIFRQYDYGARGNNAVYSSTSPPVYNLRNVRIPVVLLVGRNDQLATVQNAQKLRRQLPNVRQFTVLPRDQANHLDFIWGKTMETYVFPYILGAL